MKRESKSGFTLVEILVVIAIVSVVLVLVVPRLRTVNKDRNIREAARVVGSIFQKASQTALVEGSAGVLLERNPNFLNPVTGLPYAVTNLYLMRAVPSFSGDFFGDVADFTAAGFTVVIPRPFDHDEGAGDFFVRPGDVIYLNNQGFGYRILTVLEDATPNPPGFSGLAPNGTLTLTVDILGSSFPVPNDSLGVPFRIERQPARVESSRIALPAGYRIDLRYSGPLAPSGTETVLSATTIDYTPDPVSGASEVAVLFKDDGALSAIQAGAAATDRIDPVNTNYYFLVCEDDLELPSGLDQLDIPSNLWVTVASKAANVNVGELAPPTTTGGSFLVRLSESRLLARNRRAAIQ